MRLPEPPYPSFTLALTTAPYSLHLPHPSANAQQNSPPNGRTWLSLDERLMNTVDYRSYEEPPFSSRFIILPEIFDDGIIMDDDDKYSPGSALGENGKGSKAADLIYDFARFVHRKYRRAPSVKRDCRAKVDLFSRKD